MTADEKIEKLLNCFGQTISDLPKPEQGIFLYAYTREDLGKAHKAANEWCTGQAYTGTNTLDYICHLTDVIDRMEVALQIASECIKSARKRASLMSEGFKPLECWTYQSHPMYDLGYKDAGSTIVKLIDCYLLHEEGETNDSGRTD